MDVYFDGIIYSLQKKGGISRYFNELLKRFDYDRSLNCYLTLPPEILGELPVFKNVFRESPFQIRIKYLNVFLKRLNKLFLEKYWGKKKQGIFHSTYFTTYKNLSIPQILTVHDLAYEKLPDYFNKVDRDDIMKKRKECLDKASAIICVSENTKKDLLEYYKIEQRKLHVTPLAANKLFRVIEDSAVKEEFLKKNNIKTDYLLYVGSRAKYKNFECVLKILSLLNANTSLVVVGLKFTNEENILIDQLGIKNRIYLLKDVPDNELVLVYNCAKALIYPSFYEGFGIPLLEAFACGVPVFCSSLDVLKEIGGEAAIYFNPHDPSECANKVKVFTGDVAIAKIKKGLERVKDFSWDKTVKKTLEVYETVCYGK